jgi:hypothetical protein
VTSPGSQDSLPCPLPKLALIDHAMLSDRHQINQETVNPKINDDYHIIPRTTFQS